MNFRHLQVFHAVMLTGSVTEAAKRLNVSQPTVSTVLKHAEERIGFALFERRKGRLFPTFEATNLFPDVDSIFSKIEYFNDKSATIASGKAGLVSISSTPSLAEYVLYDAIERFTNVFPDVRIMIRVTSARNVADDVIGQLSDIGLAPGLPKTASVDYEYLCSHYITVLMSPDHPLCGLEAISLSDLSSERLLMNRRGTPVRLAIDEQFYEHGIEPSTIVEGPTLSALRLVERGVGVALLEDSFRSRNAHKTLVAKPLIPSIEIKSNIVTPMEQSRSRIADEFISYLRSASKP